MLIEALEIAERAQLIEEVKGKRGEMYAFVHALIPTTLREGLSGRRQKRLHQRLAAAIEALRPDDDEALAHHYAAADETGKAIEYSRRAARRAEAVFAYDQAVRHLRAALDMLESGEQAETRLALLEQLGDVHNTLREGSQAMPLYQEALALWRAAAQGDKMTAVRLHRKVVSAATRFERALLAEYKRFEPIVQASIETGLKLIEGEPPHSETIRLLTALSDEAWSNHTPPAWDAAEHYARAAVALAEQLESPVELSTALNALANAYGGRGWFRERVQIALRQLALSRDPRFGDKRERVSLFSQAGAALVYVGEYAQAMPHLEEAENLAREIRDMEQKITAIRQQSYCLYQLDRWDRVIEMEGKWRALEKDYPGFFGRIWAGCFQLALNASVYARRGDFERARVLREESLALMLRADGATDHWGRDNYY